MHLHSRKCSCIFFLWQCPPFYFLQTLRNLLLVGCSSSWIDLLIFLSFLFYCSLLIFLFYFLGNFIVKFLFWFFFLNVSHHIFNFQEVLFSECTFLWLHFSYFIDYNISLYFSEDINFIFFDIFYAVCLNSLASAFFALCSTLFSRVGWFLQFSVILNCLFIVMSKMLKTGCKPWVYWGLHCRATEGQMTFS